MKHELRWSINYLCEDKYVLNNLKKLQILQAYLFKTRLAECVKTREYFWNGVSLVASTALCVDTVLWLSLGRI